MPHMARVLTTKTTTLIIVMISDFVGLASLMAAPNTLNVAQIPSCVPGLVLWGWEWQERRREHFDVRCGRTHFANLVI